MRGSLFNVYLYQGKAILEDRQERYHFADQPFLNFKEFITSENAVDGVFR
jgi:hypothetical protein